MLSSSGYKVVGNSRNYFESDMLVTQFNCVYWALDFDILRKEEISQVIFCSGHPSQFQQFLTHSSVTDSSDQHFKEFLSKLNTLSTLQNFIFLSSAGALYKSNQIVSEHSPLDLTSAYSKIKFRMEKLLIEASLNSNFKYKIIRTTNVYGSTSSNMVRGGFINELLNASFNHKTFALDQNFKTIRKNFIYISDLLKVILFFVQKYEEESLLLNVANKESHTLEEVLLVCKKTLEEFDLKINYFTKEFGHIGNSGQEFDLTLLNKYVPEFQNLEMRLALNEVIDKMFRKDSY
jgi:nucleoside-diphosphate-sugar epimerase